MSLKVDHINDCYSVSEITPKCVCCTVLWMQVIAAASTQWVNLATVTRSKGQV